MQKASDSVVLEFGMGHGVKSCRKVKDDHIDLFSAVKRMSGGHVWWSEVGFRWSSLH